MELPEFFQAAFPPVPIALEYVLMRLALAVVLGAVVGVVYRLTHRGESPASPSFVATLVLLCVIIAMVTQVVGDSVGRAFTLVGALSIVRFRTVVEDTRDTAFVIFAVVVGMAAGLGNVEVGLAGLGIVSAAAMLLHGIQRFTFQTEVEWSLQLRVGTGAGSESPWEALFAKHCVHAQLECTATARQGAAVDLTYKVRLKSGVTPLQFVNEMNRLEGIQNLEMKRG
ncbi:MAG: DUF4956 domain-containing protein [Gemmataceae bacterium]|nr:DUF4956 domain-containing protein [Gemmataceae bacterium]